MMRASAGSWTNCCDDETAKDAFPDGISSGTIESLPGCAEAWAESRQESVEVAAEDCGFAAFMRCLEVLGRERVPALLAYYGDDWHHTPPGMAAQALDELKLVRQLVRRGASEFTGVSANDELSYPFLAPTLGAVGLLSPKNLEFILGSLEDLFRSFADRSAL
jgi:hypothetical protein